MGVRSVFSKKATHEERSEQAKRGHQTVGFAEREDVIFPLAEFVGGLVDRHNLSREQERFLLVRLQYSTDAACARAIGIQPTTVAAWKTMYKNSSGKVLRSGPHEKTNFHKALDELWQKNREFAEQRMAALMWKVPMRTEQMLDATKVVVRGKEEVEVPDYDAWYKGAVIASNWMDEWGQSRKVEVNPTFVAISESFQKLLEAKANQNVIEGKIVGD